MKLAVLLLPLAFAAACPAGRAAAESYAFDPNHASVTFSVRHFLAQVPGQFAKVSGTVTFDPDQPARNTVEAAVEIASLTTSNPKRDEHLRSADFFDTANYGSATFRSKVWRKTGADTYDVIGDCSFHGCTREITLRVKFLGQATGNRGAILTGWQATVTLNRADFGIGKPERSIGDDVAIIINVEARRQQPAAQAP